MDKIRSIHDLRTVITQLKSSPHFKKKFIGISSGVIIFVTFCISLYSFFHVSTDDAYINANVVQVSPQISGRVSAMYVCNNQSVKKGQPLFDIDPLPYLIAIDRAKAQLALIRQSVAEKNTGVTAAAAQVAARQAEWISAKSTLERTMQLVKRKVLSQQTGDDVTANYRRAAAALDAAKANLAQAQLDIGKPNDENDEVILAKANLRDAELNYSYTHVVAPNDGIISNLTLRAGTVVTVNQPLFALISTDAYWVDTNLKETDLKNIKPGQRAEIEVDMYPGHTFKGKVESISGGSGTAFSLLPAQNATGNWVKVTQRVPVRVRFVENDPKYPLKIGTSASVKIRI